MRNSWIIPVAVIAFLLLGTGFWGYQQYQERAQLEVYLGNQYKESFFKLVERCENLTGLLGKGVVSEGQEQMVILLSDIWQQAFAAQGDLNQLPISNAALTETSKFLIQVGDYAQALAKTNLQERQVDEEQRKKLKSLREQAATLSQNLINLQQGITEGTIGFGEIRRGARNTIEETDDQLLSNNFKNLVENNGPFPVLIYDGPFSDHIDQEQPKGLTGRTITKEDARDIASSFPDYQGNPNMVIKEIGTADGKIKAYQFSVQPEGDDQNHTTIDVSIKGGHVVFYLNPRNVGERKISREDALLKGANFLKNRGFSSMVPTYSWIEDDVLTISYAYKQDEVIIYPDLIKLKIAMDNGQIIGFESLGYIMSHRQRTLPEPEITEAEVRDLLSGRFDVQSVRLALIPTPALNEALTWEARVNYEEETYLMYYDVDTGNERNILRVIDTPEGTFAR